MKTATLWHVTVSVGRRSENAWSSHHVIATSARNAEDKAIRMATSQGYKAVRAIKVELVGEVLL